MEVDLKSGFGDTFEPKLIQEIIEVCTLKKIDEGTKIIEIGQYIKGMPLVLSGAIKILREDENGDELLLYYIETGDTCSMTMACCLGDAKSEIRAIAETDVELIMIPIRKIEEWTRTYTSWRNFIFNSYHNRLNELLYTVDTIAFKNMDQRLITYLKEKSRITGSNKVMSTHQEIAADLHSSRVVVSRLLKKLEHLGKIKLHRNQIEILQF